MRNWKMKLQNGEDQISYWIVFEIESSRIVVLDIIHGALNPDNYKNI